mmetsp:Transcript_27405/g.50324  ORF Transcript_27405/g.50324 Transcript_27405/m.50324 type:complete len:93 (-) Transcript_27405:17-295(-)
MKRHRYPELNCTAENVAQLRIEVVGVGCGLSFMMARPRVGGLHIVCGYCTADCRFDWSCTEKDLLYAVNMQVRRSITAKAIRDSYMFWSGIT